jgi:hypothetical protein
MTPNPQTEDELGIAPDAYAHHDETDCVPAFEEPRPTPKQLAYLRTLAQRTGQTFAYPRTASQASREIRRLKNTPASSRTEVRIERKQIADQIAAGPANNSTAVRVDEISGHGSTATWAHNRDRKPAGPPKPAPKCKTPEVGPRTELARYTIAGQARIVFGQRVDGVVRFLPGDLVVLVLGRALSEDSSCRSRSRGSDGARADAVRRKRPNVVGECDGAAAECLEDRS